MRRNVIGALAAAGIAALAFELGSARAEDPVVARRHAAQERARETGQWGCPAHGLTWGRSVEAAVAENGAAAKPKPLLVLHLFGKFDEEFC
jgi:hypothetical protein